MQDVCQEADARCMPRSWSVLHCGSML